MNGGKCMKKRTGFRIFASFLALVFFLLSFSACAVKVKNSDFFLDYSLKQSAVFRDSDGNEVKPKFSGKDGDYIDITFSEPVNVNTLVLYEKGDNITAFEIFVNRNGSFESIYKQDKVGEFRYCAFNPEMTTALRLQIQKTRDGSFSLNDIDVLNAVHTRTSFGVTAYAVTDTILSPDSIDPTHLQVISDFILFGAVTFDETGKLSYNEFTLDGKTISGQEALKIAIDNIRAVESSSEPAIYINLLGPDGDVDTKEEKHNQVFEEHADTLIAEIQNLLNTFDVDGVAFDYEYPYKNSGWKAYSKFLVALDKAIPDKKISISLAPWGGKLTDDAKAAVDNYEWMSYDLFDDDGYHAPFSVATDTADFLNSNGYDLEKSALGLPFYGRPTDKSEIWTNYYECAERLGKYGNLDTAPLKTTLLEGGETTEETVTTPRYLNSYQMVFDKAAFAYDYGFSGMMVWHYACDAKADTGLSLFEAIAEAILSRQP